MTDLTSVLTLVTFSMASSCCWEERDWVTCNTHLGWPHQYYACWPIFMAFWHSQGALNGQFYPRQRPMWRKASENPNFYISPSKQRIPTEWIHVLLHSSPSSRNRLSTRLSISVDMMTFSFFLLTFRSISTIGPIKMQAFCFPITKLIIFFNEGAVEKNILNYYIACKRWLLAGGPEERRTREPLYIEKSDEYGQKRNCPSSPHSNALRMVNGNSLKKGSAKRTTVVLFTLGMS